MGRELIDKAEVLGILDTLEHGEQRLYEKYNAPESFGALGALFRAAARIDTLAAVEEPILTRYCPHCGAEMENAEEKS